MQNLNISKLNHYQARFGKILCNKGITLPKTLQPITDGAKKVAQNAHGDELFISKTKIPTASKIAAQSGLEIPEALQKAWDKVIKKIIHQSTETMYLHNAVTGEQIAETTINTENSCTFDKKNLKKFSNAIKQGIKIASIHNHPYEIDFSAIDLGNILLPKKHHEIMLMVTREGGFAILKNSNKKSSLVNNKLLIQAYTSLEMGSARKAELQGKSDAEIITEWQKLRKIHIPQLAEKFGYQHYYNPGTFLESHVSKIPSYGEVYKQLAASQGLPEEIINNVISNTDYHNPQTFQTAFQSVKELDHYIRRFQRLQKSEKKS